MSYGKRIELFLPTGSAENLIIAEIGNWNGKAFKVPRIDLKTLNEEETQRPGVYFLFWKDEADKECVYIGESEHVKTRLGQHLNNKDEEWSSQWTTAVIFIGADLNKANIRYLENRLANAARNGGFQVITKNTSDSPIRLSEAEMMREFEDNIRILLNAFGYKVFEPISTKSNTDTDNIIDKEDNIENIIFHFKQGVADAKGKLRSDGCFILLEGTRINEKTTDNNSSKAIKFRQELMDDNDYIENYTTKRDRLFNSPAQAISFVLGYNGYSKANWVTDDGRTLKKIESIVTNNTAT